jgi:hypothetical protein
LSIKFDDYQPRPVESMSKGASDLLGRIEGGSKMRSDTSKSSNGPIGNSGSVTRCQFRLSNTDQCCLLDLRHGAEVLLARLMRAPLLPPAATHDQSVDLDLLVVRNPPRETESLLLLKIWTRSSKPIML